MAINSVATVIEYDCDGATTRFPITFTYLADANIIVKHYDDSTQTLSDLANPAGYEVVSDEVETVETYPIDDKIFITLDMDFTQETDLEPNGKIGADVLDLIHDKLTLMCQQLRLETDSVIGLEIPEPDADMSLPNASLRASRYLAFDSLGNATVVSSLDVGTATISAYGETIVAAANADALQTLADVYSTTETDSAIDTEISTLESDLAGVGRTTETIKDNADDLEAFIATLETRRKDEKIAIAAQSIGQYNDVAGQFTKGSTDNIEGIDYSPRIYLSSNTYFPGFYFIIQSGTTFTLYRFANGGTAQTVLSTTSFALYDVISCNAEGSRIIMIGENASSAGIVWISTNYGQTFTQTATTLTGVAGDMSLGIAHGKLIVKYTQTPTGDEHVFSSALTDGTVWTLVQNSYDDTIIIEEELYARVNAANNVNLYKYNGTTWDALTSLAFTGTASYNGCYTIDDVLYVNVRYYAAAEPYMDIYSYDGSAWTLYKTFIPDISITGSSASMYASNNIVAVRGSEIFRHWTPEEYIAQIKPTGDETIWGKGLKCVAVCPVNTTIQFLLTDPYIT